MKRSAVKTNADEIQYHLEHLNALISQMTKAKNTEELAALRDACIKRVHGIYNAREDQIFKGCKED